MKPTNKLFFDIETSSDPNALLQRIDFVDRKLGNEDRINFLPEFNQVITIAIGRIKDDGQIEVKNLEGTEQEMIEKFYTYVEKYMLCGYNILAFDIPFIAKRGLKYGLKVPPPLMLANAKPWDLTDRFIDLARLYQGPSFTMSALEDVAIHLGIPTPKDIMHGSEVQAYYNDGKIDLIKEYCRHDVKCTGLIYQRLKELNFI